tara:strand:- start:366 stop:1919 length:1554 start_codon:yes stop_codon:yes gene_type:complete
MVFLQLPFIRWRKIEVLTLSPFQKFLANVGWTVLGKTGVQIIMFAVSIILTRYLGKENLGDYATILVIPVFIRLLNSFGLETLINKILPELNVKDPSESQGHFLVSRIIVLRFLTTIGFCILIYLFLPNYLNFIHNTQLIEFRWTLIFYFAVISIDSILSVLYMAQLRFKALAITEVCGALTNLVLLVLFIRLDYGIYAVLFAYIISATLTSSVYLILSKIEYPDSTHKPEWNNMGHLAWVAYGIGLFGFGVMTQSDVLLMNYFKINRGDVGLYHLATALGATLPFLLAGIAPMALSLFSETYAKDGAKGLSNLYCKIMGFASYLTIPIYVFCAINSVYVIEFIYGIDFSEGRTALTIYAIFAGIQTALGVNFSVSALFVVNQRDIALRSTVEGSILNIALNLFMIPLFGMLGAITATGITMVYMVSRQLKVLSSEIEIKSGFSIVGQCFLFCLLASIPLPILSIFGWGHLITNFLIYLTTFFLLLVVLKPFNNEQRQLLTNMYPVLSNKTKWFFRT